MAERVRFRIGDLVVLVAVSGLAFGGVAFIRDAGSVREVGEAAFWLIVLAVASIVYVVFRFVPTRETGLILLGLGVAFAGAAASVYLGVYLDMKVEAACAVAGLMAVALVLVGGGVAQGLLTRWHELKLISRVEPDSQTDRTPPP